MIQRMREATRRFDNGIEAIVKRFDLTVPQYEVLAEVFAGPNADATLGDLADSIHCSRGNLTGIADRLEKAGLIERLRSKEDRRVVYIVMTPTGADVARLAVLAVDTYMNDTSAYLSRTTGLTAENIDTVLALVSKEGNVVVA